MAITTLMTKTSDENNDDDIWQQQKWQLLRRQWLLWRQCRWCHRPWRQCTMGRNCIEMTQSIHRHKSLSYELGSEESEQKEQCGASNWVSGRAYGHRTWWPHSFWKRNFKNKFTSSKNDYQCLQPPSWVAQWLLLMATAKAAVMIDNTFVDNYDENNNDNNNNNIVDNDCRRHHEARYHTLYLTHQIFLDFHEVVYLLRGSHNPQRALRRKGRNLSEYGISCASGGLKSTSINMKKKVVFIYISILYNIPENLNAKSFFV